MLLHDVDRARHESGFRPKCQRKRIKGPRIGAEGSEFGFLPEFRSRRLLPLRQAIDAIVEHEHLDAHVAAEHMNGVIAADGKRVAVSSSYPDFEFRMRNLDPGGHGRRAPVDRMEPERIHLIGKTAPSTHAGYDHQFLPKKPP